MLALCLMLSVIYYAQNYVCIIGWSLCTTCHTFQVTHLIFRETPIWNTEATVILLFGVATGMLDLQRNHYTLKF